MTGVQTCALPILLTGSKPMTSAQARSLEYAHFKEVNYPGMKLERWILVSAEGKEVVLGLLQRCPTKRMTAQQVRISEAFVAEISLRSPRK